MAVTNKTLNRSNALVLGCIFLLWSLLACPFCEAKSWADIASNRHQTPTLLRPEEEHDRSTVSTLPPKKKATPAAGVYSKLPPGVSGQNKYRVRNVYDGDTLTLEDGRRVRLLGIDTPELQPLQPFGLEAKDYTKGFCHKREIYLQGTGTDRYGRLLSVIWVPLSDGTFLNVCEGLVANGLATVYHVADEPDSLNPKLVALQKQARQNQRGLWKDFTDRNVVTTKYGAAYHLPTCRHLANSRNTRIMAASKALDKGLHPCRTCLGDE